MDVDVSGNVYYTDFYRHLVHRYDVSGGGYSPAATYGTDAQVMRGNAGFQYPWGIAVNASGSRIVVGDNDFEVHELGTDTTKPKTTAYAASVKHGKSLTFKYRVTDARPTSGQAVVTIKIYKNGTRKRLLPAGTHATNGSSKLSFTWHCNLAKGAYTFKVYAQDLDGNTQSQVGSAKLTVT